MELLAVVWTVISSAGIANTVPAWSSMDYDDLTTTGKMHVSCWTIWKYQTKCEYDSIEAMIPYMNY